MNETTTRENMMRAMIASKQLEIDKLKHGTFHFQILNEFL